MTDKIAWVHPNPMLAGYVVLPDGYQMATRDARAKGFTVAAWPDHSKIATAHPHEPDAVILPRGTVVSRDTAKTAGFEISSHAPSPSGGSISSWRAAIFASPEARDRPSAVAEIVTTQSPNTMTAEAARAFLRGLPLEEQEHDQPMTTEANDPKEARLAEISRSMQAINKDRGYASNKSHAAAHTLVDPARAERLAQIEQTVSVFNRGRGYQASSKAQPALKQLTQARLAQIGPDCDEAKLLSYALEAHEQTGAPLSRCLAQLGVDTSKIVRSN